jgi:hypothetical protein
MTTTNINRWQMTDPFSMTPEYIGDLSKAHELAKQRTDLIRPYRKHTRARMFREIKTCQFPGCSQKPSEMHELVNRGRTNPHTWQRLLTYQPQLCSLLCQEHHEQAHNPKARNLLFLANYRQYGPVSFKRAYDLLKLAWPSLDIELPVAT